jgi:hypothetical protein
VSVTRICRYRPCSKEFTPNHPRQEFCEPTCRASQHYLDHPEKGRVLQGDALRSVATHPLADARVQQEESKTNKCFGLLIRQAIIDRLKTVGECHADDLEPLYPANDLDRKRCRKLAGAQFGSLASPHGGGPLIREKSRRKSTVPERKGAKSGVYEFTKAGWDRWGTARVDGDEKGTGERSTCRPFSGASVHPGESGPIVPGSGGGVANPQGPPETPFSPVGAAAASPEPLSLLPEPDPEAWAA